MNEKTTKCYRCCGAGVEVEADQFCKVCRGAGVLPLTDHLICKDCGGTVTYRCKNDLDMMPQLYDGDGQRVDVGDILGCRCGVVWRIGCDAVSGMDCDDYFWYELDRVEVPEKERDNTK